MDTMNSVEMTEPGEARALRSTDQDLAVMARIGKRQQLRVRSNIVLSIRSND